MSLKNIKVDVKSCNKCLIILNDENKTKGRNICKTCKKLMNSEYKKLIADKHIGLKCNKCEVILTEENKVNARQTCKICYNIRKKEYKKII